MSNKKPRPPSAQNLIDSLLDEKSSVRPTVNRGDGDQKADQKADQKPDPNTVTSSIVIDLQERIDERTANGRKPNTNANTNANTDETNGSGAVGINDHISEFSMSGNDLKLFELSSPDVAEVLDPVARAMRNDPPATASELPRPQANPAKHPVPPAAVAPTAPATARANPVEINDTDERTLAVAPTSRTVNPKTSTDPSPTSKSGPASILKGRGNHSGDVEFGTLDRMMPTEIKVAGGQTTRETKQKVASSNYAQAGAAFSSTEASLKQSESLRVAQKRITELEQELERLRRENENLSTAGETLRRRTDELLTKTEQLESQNREAEKIHDNEKHIYRGQLHQKDRDIGDYRTRLDEMEGRLENNFKKIRVRERELEHRLELIKMESATLISGKDKMLLDLKRQIDQLAHENSYGKQKSAELFNQFKGKQETIRRVVRALRIALTILEGDEDAAPTQNGANSKKNDP